MTRLMWLELLIWAMWLTGLGADWADRADRGDRTDVAEMALRMNALFYFDCVGHKELKNIAYNGLWKLYAVTWSDGKGRDGRIIRLRLL